MKIATTENVAAVDSSDIWGEPHVPEDASVTLTANEAQTLKHDALESFARAELEERYGGKNKEEDKRRLWQRLKKLIDANLISIEEVRSGLNHHRSSTPYWAKVAYLEEAPQYVRMQMRDGQEACTCDDGRRTLLCIDRTSMHRLEKAVRSLVSRQGCEDLTVQQLAMAYFPKWMSDKIPDLTFPTSDEVLSELVRDLGLDLAHNAYVASCFE
jgi:hypothetical protein